MHYKVNVCISMPSQDIFCCKQGCDQIILHRQIGSYRHLLHTNHLFSPQIIMVTIVRNFTEGVYNRGLDACKVIFDLANT
jgi:hypothetical protein